MVRRTPAEVNAALAGVTLVVSFARFKVPIATFSDGRTSWDLSPMVEIARK